MSHYHRLVLYFDGASRNNPHGPAGCGWVLYTMDSCGADDDLIARGQKYLEYNVSNNQAEYSGLKEGLDYLYNQDISCHGLYIRGDSEIVINQLEGYYQVRSPNIIDYYHSALHSLSYVDNTFVKYKHIDRSKNWEADELANSAISDGYDYIYD